jgi:hypothetical protein
MAIIRAADQPIELLGVEAPCLKCGCRIAVTVPRRLVSTGGAPGKRAKTLPGRLELRPGFGDPGLCLDCRLAVLPSADIDVVAAQYESFQKGAAAAGIPGGAIIWVITFAADGLASKRWQSWVGHLLAIQVSGLPPRLKDAPGLNSYRFEMNDGREPVEIIVYETVVGREDLLPTALVFRSPPGVWPALLEVRDWSQVDRPSRLQELMQGVELYHALSDGRGRPRGGPYETAADFASALYPIVTKYRSAGIRPTQERVAEHIGVTVKTLRTWIGNYLHSEWGDVLAWSELDWRRMMQL